MMTSATFSDAPQPRALQAICEDMRRKVLEFVNNDKTDDKTVQDTQAKVRIALDVIGQALERYGLEQVSISYNGGKDCLVLLVLILASLPAWAALASPASPESPLNGSETSDEGRTPAESRAQLTPDAFSRCSSSSAPASARGSPSPSPHATDAVSQAPSPATSNGPIVTTTTLSATRTFPESLQAVYVVSKQPFQEVEDFVVTSAREYHLEVARYAMPMRAALDAYLEAKQRRIKAVFVGTRRSDPHGQFLSHFDPTDHGWPAFMRVHPVIDWHYVEIWTFIRYLGIPFCPLYNQGFTSLGGKADTHPNPVLAVDGDASRFRPAYELTEDEEERLGRG